MYKFEIDLDKRVNVSNFETLPTFIEVEIINMGESQAKALTVKDILANVATVATNTSSKQVDLKAVLMF